jgi:hypothetical protein
MIFQEKMILVRVYPICYFQNYSPFLSCKLCPPFLFTKFPLFFFERQLHFLFAFQMYALINHTNMVPLDFVNASFQCGSIFLGIALRPVAVQI